ncbi:MAG: hypothetical protein O7E53_08745 [Alphaproteobacteria bacterium]|nr:hypothetical protein [Alphaproteobacteria bacterium]
MPKSDDQNSRSADTGQLADLRIAQVEAIPVAIPLTKPMIMGSERIVRATNVIVRLETEDGQVGWGEATSAPTMTGDLQAGMVAAITDYLAPALIGANPLDLDAIGNILAHRIHANNAAKAAVDLAVHDLAGRFLGVPVVDLFGGAVRESLSPMWLVGTPTPEENAREAAAKRAEGIRFFKLKVGTKTLANDILAAGAVREAIGAETDMAADANMAWSVNQATEFVHATGGLGMLYLEQPVRDDDLAGMAAIAKGPVPIAADEGIHGFDSIESHARMGAASGAGLKLIKFGGCARILKAAKLCERLGLKINLASKVAESSIAAAGLVHVAAAIPSLEWGVSISNHYLSDDLVAKPLLPVNGFVAVPRSPGLGIEVDPNRIDAHRI